MHVKACLDQYLIAITSDRREYARIPSFTCDQVQAWSDRDHCSVQVSVICSTN